MDFLSDLLGGLGSFDFEPIVKLTVLSLILLAGPVIVFLLAFQGGDL